jgi:hypothetical protein
MDCQTHTLIIPAFPGRVYSVEGRTKEPQRLGAAEPQPKYERPLNRRDAMSAEKTAGEKILLEMHDSGFLHCDARKEKTREQALKPFAVQ